MARGQTSKELVSDGRLPAPVLKAVNTLIEAARPRCVIVFGSYATGRAQQDSGLDVIFVVERGPSRDVAVELRKRWRALRRRTPELPIIDLLAYAPQEFRQNFVVGFVPYEALREGMVLHGRAPEVGTKVDEEGA